MHSSRMRTVRSSGRIGGVSATGGCVPTLGVGCLVPRGGCLLLGVCSGGGGGYPSMH